MKQIEDHFIKQTIQLAKTNMKQIEDYLMKQTVQENAMLKFIFYFHISW